MATYSEDDFKRVAAAIGKDVADVQRHEKAFEAAATWYRLSRNAPKGKRITPYIMRRRMTQIANAAQRLLEHLGVSDPTQAPDGPATAVLEVLATADDGTEDAVIRATARLGRLLELLGAVDATRELEQHARKAADDAVQIGELIVPKGHHGDTAVNGWIAAMMSIYKKVTGKDPRTSIIAPGRPGRGNADGPLIRFLDAAYGPCLVAAGEPLDTAPSPGSWRGRVRDVLTDGRRKK